MVSLPIILETRVLKYLEGLHELYVYVKTIAAEFPAIDAQVQRSFLQDPIPKHALQLLSAHGFVDVPRDLAEAISGLFGLGQTVVNEQANRSVKNAAEREADHARIGHTRLLLVPYRERVLSHLNKFNEIKHTDHTSAHAAAASTTKLKKEYFSPQQASELPLKWVADKNQATFWDTTTKDSVAQNCANIAFWRFARQDGGAFGKLGNTWLIKLAVPGMLLRKSAAAPWTFFLKNVSNTAGLVWHTCEILVDGGKKSYRPLAKLMDGPVYDWLVIVDPKDIEVHEYSWRSPLRTICAVKAAGASGSASSSSKCLPAGHIKNLLDPRMLTRSLIAEPKQANPTSLPHASALRAFGKMSLVEMCDFAVSVAGVAVPAGADTFDATLFLVKHYHPMLDDPSLFEIVSRKFLQDPQIDKLFASEEARDALGDEDIKFLDKYIEENLGETRQKYLLKSAKAWARTSAKKCQLKRKKI